MGFGLPPRSASGKDRRLPNRLVRPRVIYRMKEIAAVNLEELAAHLASRRRIILDAWRAESQADPAQPTAGSLTRAQFNDHIPEVLDALERMLRSQPGSARADRAVDEIHVQEVKHGQQRWQQGYRLQELLREWGHLHQCLAREVETFAVAHPTWGYPAFAAAQHALIRLINAGISESGDQYGRMERAEAAGRVNDLEQAITQVNRLEHRRSQLIHQAVHDLRGDVQSVRNVAELLGSSDIAEEERVEFAGMLQTGVDAVGKMLTDLMDLARLEAGQEHRTIAPFNAGTVLLELCRVARPTATTQQIYLRTDGPTSLEVEGDAQKVRRLLQNLLFNALKYTRKGGVTVSWGRDKDQWWLSVKDTGPGLMAGPGAPLAVSLREATVTARETDVKAAAAEGRESAVLDQAKAGSSKPVTSHQNAGEGIGLSIVKRLCELLDASLELVSSSESGTTLRVVFPLAYQQPPR